MEKSNLGPYIIQLKGDKSAKFKEWVTGHDEYAASLCIGSTDRGMLGYFLAYTDAEIEEKFPGSVRIPPVEKPERPAPADRNYQNLLSEYKLNQKDYEIFIGGVEACKQGWLHSIDETDRAILENHCGANPITIARIYSFFKSKYGKLSAETKANLERIIEGDLNITLSLEANISAMNTANSTLLLSRKNFSDFQMYEALLSKMVKNNKTKKIVENFVSRDGFDANDVDYANFCEYAIKQWENRIVLNPPVYGGAAVDASAFGAIGPEVLTDAPHAPTDAASTVAAAGISSPGKKLITVTMTEEDYVAYMSPDKTRDKKNPAPEKVKPIAPGYCIKHGFTTHGPGVKSASGEIMWCRVMAEKNGTPKAGYTIAQVNCKNPKGGPVDNMERSQNCDTRFSRP